MTAMSPLRSILNDTPATAIDVDWNFQTLEDYIATDVIKSDGSTAMQAPLNLLGPPPSLATHAITKGYVDANVIPVGTIWQFAGPAAPAAWVLCDGTSKSTTDPLYAALFAVIGYTYGGSGTNFNLPNLQGRVPIGRQAGDARFGLLNSPGGSRDLIVPSHVHAADAHQHGGNTNNADTNHTHDLQGHTHYLQHSHDSGLRYGYDVNSGGFAGPSNAVANPGASVPQGTALIFTTRKTAIAVGQEDGANHQPTYGSNRDYSDGPNPNGTGWAIQNNPHSHPFATDFRTPTIQPAGVSPTDANLPPYIVVNYIIRTG